jgi:predicted nucleic acid-binding protein
MLSLRLIIDTNVLISAALHRLGSSALFSWSPFPNRRTFTCRDLSWRNTAKCLARPELRIRRGSRQQLPQLIKKHNDSVFPARWITVTSDPDDNIFLECADAARADYPVGQSETFSEILEENQDQNATGVHWPYRASSNQIASASLVSPMSPLGYLGKRYPGTAYGGNFFPSLVV